MLILCCVPGYVFHNVGVTAWEKLINSSAAVIEPGKMFIQINTYVYVYMQNTSNIYANNPLLNTNE